MKYVVKLPTLFFTKLRPCILNENQGNQFTKMPIHCLLFQRPIGDTLFRGTVEAGLKDPINKVIHVTSFSNISYCINCE